jgi:hypothetical protein
MKRASACMASGRGRQFTAAECVVVGCERDMVCCNCKRNSAAWHLAGAELAQRGGGGRLVQLRFLVLHLLALRLPLLLLLPARRNSMYVAHTRMSSLCGAKQRDFAVAQRAALCWSCSQVRAVILSLTVDRLVMMMRLLGMMFRCAQAAAACGLVNLHQAQAELIGYLIRRASSPDPTYPPMP